MSDLDPEDVRRPPHDLAPMLHSAAPTSPEEISIANDVDDAPLRHWRGDVVLPRSALIDVLPWRPLRRNAPETERSSQFLVRVAAIVHARAGWDIRGYRRPVLQGGTVRRGEAPGYVLLEFEEQPIGDAEATTSTRGDARGRQGCHTDLEATKCELQSMYEELASALEELEWREDELRRADARLRLLEDENRRGLAELDRLSRELERERQEQRYRTLFVSIDQAFCVIDVIFEPSGEAVDYSFVEANPAFHKHTGIAQAAGRRMREIVPDLEGHWLRDFGHVARTGEAVRFEAPARALGREFDVQAFRLGGVGSRRVAVLLQDVSDRSRLVHDLRSTADQLSDANRRKDEYLAMLGHELRNPLAAIRGATELLRLLDGNDGRLVRAREVLERQSSHMARLIDGLLEVSRLVRGKLHIERTTLDLRRVLEAVLDDRVAQLSRRGLNLERRIEGAPVWVHADPTRLAQVADNLLGNAIKFTHPGGSICVSLVREGMEAVLRVRDTGVGIRPEMLARVFEAFQQEGQTMARSAGGLGLGLALAKGIVELHEGQIVARSEGPDRGAELEVRLPLAQEPTAQVPPAPQAEPFAPCRVLVVEDNADAAQMLCDLLEAHGYAVRVADTGGRALKWLRESSFDIALCDIGLPGMSGLELARAVRSDPRMSRTPLVALTGFGQAEDRTRSVEAGFDEHLVKPVDVRVLEGVIARLVSTGG